MRQITKSAEPATLTQHRLQTHANYDNYPDKDGLRRSLCAEQLSVCCYCAGRIFSQPDKMKIEHFSSQEHHEGLQLTYSNLLGACLGGQGNAPRDQHCDTHKGSSALSRSPASPTNIENFLTYSGDGTITSRDEVFDRELNEVLNLNHPTLKQNRKSTLTPPCFPLQSAHPRPLCAYPVSAGHALLVPPRRFWLPTQFQVIGSCALKDLQPSAGA